MAVVCSTRWRLIMRKMVIAAVASLGVLAGCTTAEQTAVVGAAGGGAIGALATGTVGGAAGGAFIGGGGG
jgi:hypothetical protein